MANDGFISFTNSQGQAARGTLMHLTRHQAVFEVYNPYSIVQLSEVLSGLRIQRGERTLYDGRAVVSNLVNTGLMLIVSATLVDPWVELATRPTGRSLRGEIDTFFDDWASAYGCLELGYKDSVIGFRNFLEELSRWLDQGEAIAGIDQPDASESEVRAFVTEVNTALAPRLGEMLERFESEARAVPMEFVTAHKTFARRELHPVVMCSPFLHRTFNKPLGYAGDYEMVNMIFRDPADGPSTYAKIINMLNLETPPAQAHRNRIDILIDWLDRLSAPDIGRPLEVLNVACGPAIELQRMTSHEAFDRCRFTLLDFNAETLAYAQEQIEAAARPHGRRPELEIVHKSIHELLKEATRNRGGDGKRYDVVYCAGLFDYLSDKICRRLLSLFATWTRPGGQVMATNVHSDNPVKLYMDHVVEWHLVYRNDEEMAALAPPGLPQRVYRDATGINVFLEFDIPEPEG